MNRAGKSKGAKEGGIYLPCASSRLETRADHGVIANATLQPRECCVPDRDRMYLAAGQLRVPSVTTQATRACERNVIRGLFEPHRLCVSLFPHVTTRRGI